MKLHKLRKFRVKTGFVLAAILREGEKESDVHDERKQVIVLNGQDAKALVNLFRELKLRKFQTGINYHVLDRILRNAKRGNVDPKSHTEGTPCPPDCKCNGGRNGCKLK